MHVQGSLFLSPHPCYMQRTLNLHACILNVDIVAMCFFPLSVSYSVLHICSSWWSPISNVDHGENRTRTSLFYNLGVAFVVVYNNRLHGNYQPMIGLLSCLNDKAFSYSCFMCTLQPYWSHLGVSTSVSCEVTLTYNHKVATKDITE